MNKIFVVEDDTKIRAEICTLLERYNYQCETSDDYQNMVECILTSDAQLVLLDISPANELNAKSISSLIA